MGAGNDTSNKIALEPGEQPMGVNSESHSKQPDKQHEPAYECEPYDRLKHYQPHARSHYAGLDHNGHKCGSDHLPLAAFKCPDSDFDV